MNFIMAESGTRQRVRGTVYFVQEIFLNQHNGIQGSGISHAKCETQSLRIELPTDAKYFPILFVPRLHRASTPTRGSNASPNVRQYAYIESGGTVFF